MQLSFVSMVSCDFRGIVNNVIVLLLAKFPQKAIYFTPFYFLFFNVFFDVFFLTRIMMLDMLTSCISFLIDVPRSIIDLAISFDDLSDDRSLYQRARWNDPHYSLSMVLRNRSCILFLHLKGFYQALYYCTFPIH